MPAIRFFLKFAWTLNLQGHENWAWRRVWMFVFFFLKLLLEVSMHCSLSILSVPSEVWLHYCSSGGSPLPLYPSDLCAIENNPHHGTSVLTISTHRKSFRGVVQFCISFWGGLMRIVSIQRTTLPPSLFWLCSYEFAHSELLILLPLLF